MKLSLFGRLGMALFASLALGLGMTACGGDTIGYMWVLGQQYSQITGFKIDNYTGNLTGIIKSPFASQGSTPVSIIVKSGGRYVYVINQGVAPTTCAAGTSCVASGHGTGQSVALFSVGGDGTLTFQQSYQSQGYNSQWAQMDSTGTYLYVLDQYSPGYDATTGLYDLPNTDGDGAITVFAADSTTGRLSLVENTQTLRNDVATPFFEVGASPFMMKTSSGCLFTVNGADQSITPYSIGTGGQLVVTTTGTFPTVATRITSINGSGSYMFLTDAGSNTIDGYTVASSCTLTALEGGGVTPNFAGTSNPVYTFLDSTSRYLYVLNQSTTITTPTIAYSSISAFTLNATNQELQQIVGAPYTVGSSPVCMVEDPTNQYLYVSDHIDGTITGKVLDSTTGTLADLSRGSTFASSGLPGCLVDSGAVD